MYRRNPAPVCAWQPSLEPLRSVQPLATIFRPTSFSSVQNTLALSRSFCLFVYYLVPPFWSIYALVFNIPVTAMLDARGYLAWTLLGIILFFFDLIFKVTESSNTTLIVRNMRRRLYVYLSLTTPFTEGRLGVNNKASAPGRHQEQAPKQRCSFSPTTFSSVQSIAKIVKFRTRG